MKKIIKFLKDQRGTTILEYAIITAAASLGITAAIKAFANHYNYKIETFLNEVLPFMNL